MPNYGSLWSVENAIAQGYLEEEGITVNLVEFQDGPTIISAMESGSIDVGYIGQGAHKLCINGQATIFALSHISNGDALIGGEGITSIEDLKGKQVAYSSGTSSEDILVNSLTSVGLTMDDIEAIDMDASGIVSAMLSGKVDAAATWSPNSLKILEEDANATKLADNMTFSDKTVSCKLDLHAKICRREQRCLSTFHKSIIQSNGLCGSRSSGRYSCFNRKTDCRRSGYSI